MLGRVRLECRGSDAKQSAPIGKMSVDALGTRAEAGESEKPVG
jgi:hypothetical protein